MEVRSYGYSTPGFKKIPGNSRSNLSEPGRGDGFYDFPGNPVVRFEPMRERCYY